MGTQLRRAAIAVSMIAALAVASISSGRAQEKAPPANDDDTYSEDEIRVKAEDLFGATTKGLAQAIGKVFSDLGQPNGYIIGEEFGGAFFVGIRYGRGELHQKKITPQKVYWQGPSVGFDFGGNASKVFTLVYDLKQPGDIYRRFPGVDGSLYVVAGLSLNYQRAGSITLAPIRTGVGLRAGVNIGYLHYNREHSWLPF